MDRTELHEWRKSNGYSQSDLAIELGVSTNTVSRWERGELKIPPFLHIALKCLKKKGGEIRKAGRPPKDAAKMKTKRRK
ncbi:MAG: helix-turn-helix domain-containing protein [Alphaproteobacteria bacterium]|uniref:Helix-turn-helix domain-containing protein n=1 Tax=Candidatus Nitrobium versatile TaxID=2884831 RepID=A0A953LWT4_9BACT|nr:helix-turn-helix domain-containing protein [Candidatus Nitrobium versatile]